MYRGHEQYSTVRIKKSDIKEFKVLSVEMELTAPELIRMLLDFYVDENKINIK